MPAPLSGARALSERAQACHVIWAPGSMLGRQASRATCRQNHCLSAMQPGRPLAHAWRHDHRRLGAAHARIMLDDLESPNVVCQAARFRRARRSSVCILTANDGHGLSGTCSFLTAWRATRSRCHPQRLASRVLHVQRAPTARRRSTRALAVRLSAVGVAVTFGRGRTPCPSPPEGQPHQPLVYSTSLRTRSLVV